MGGEDVGFVDGDGVLGGGGGEEGGGEHGGGEGEEVEGYEEEFVEGADGEEDVLFFLNALLVIFWRGCVMSWTYLIGVV